MSPDVSAGVPLSPRERQVLARVADGMSNEEIAADLGVKVETARTTVRRMRGKMGAANRAHAVHLGWKTGLLS